MAAAAAAAAAAATADEPTVPMEEQPGKESEEVAEAMEEQLGKESEEADEAMEEQLGKESEDATESAEAVEQIEEPEEVGDPAEAMEQIEEPEEGGDPAEAMEQIEEPEEVGDPAEAMETAGVEAEAEAEAEDGASLRPVLPAGRVKQIMRVDRDIKKVTTEAALLIAAATELFLGSLATGAHTAASRRGRRTVRAVHVRAAARAHRPTADFLLDCLAAEEEAPGPRKAAGSAGGSGGGGGEAKPLPRGTRRIDAFFQKVT